MRAGRGCHEVYTETQFRVWLLDCLLQTFPSRDVGAPAHPWTGATTLELCRFILQEVKEGRCKTEIQFFHSMQQRAVDTAGGRSHCERVLEEKCLRKRWRYPPCSYTFLFLIHHNASNDHSFSQLPHPLPLSLPSLSSLTIP